VISIRNTANEQRIAGLVLTETNFSVRVGGEGWGVGIAYRAPRSASSDGQHVIIRDYVLLVRLASLILLFFFMSVRRGSK
jgi:hypothetical protein